MLSRRFFLQGAALAALGTVLDGAPRPASAAPAAQVSRQAPGYFRLMVGDVEVTALYDGGLRLPPSLLHGQSPEVLGGLLADAGIDPRLGAPIAINAFLFDLGQGPVLVDTGVGVHFGDKAGLLPANLRAAGYDPASIGTVLLTHMHSDHSLGLTDASGASVFPKARLRVHRAEAAFWLDPGAESRIANEGQRRFLAAIQASVAPYRSAGRFTPFAAGEAPATGVEAVPLPGHTPGHCAYRVRSKDAAILFWGDVVHVLAVQFPRPGVVIDFDVAQSEAAAARGPLMAGLAKDKEWVAGAHLPFPGIGRLQAVGEGYAWWPAIYAVPSGI